MRYGLVTSLLILVITLNLFLASKPEISVLWNQPLLSLSQLLSLWGTALLAITFVLSGRFRFLEGWFGGMDRLYQFHHKTGVVAFVMILHHPMLLAVRVLPNFGAAGIYLFPGTNIAYLFGILGLYSMILMLILTVLVRLPYHIWLMTHQFMGWSLLLASVHIYLIPSDVSSYLPLRLWMVFLLGLAGGSFVYKKFLYRWWAPRTGFVVARVKRIYNLMEIYLESTGKFEFRAGQFGFVKIDEEGMSKETHPFSFSSAPDEKMVRLSIKTAGDYTRSLKRIKKGDRVTIHGPYGMFGRNFFGEKEVVAIAGGIGVTPFLSLLHQEEKDPKKRKIHFIFGNRSEDEAFYVDELMTLEKKLKNMKLTWHFSNKEARITADLVAKATGGIKDKLIYLCGPTGMMLGLRDQFVALGVSPRNIYFEDFSLK